MGEIVEEMADDDAADIIGGLEPHEQARVLSSVSPPDATEIQELLSYPEESAGGIMTRNVLAVGSDLTAMQAIRELRRMRQEDIDFYTIFVTGAGWCPARGGVAAGPRSVGSGSSDRRNHGSACGRGTSFHGSGGRGSSAVSLQSALDRSGRREFPPRRSGHVRRRDRRDRVRDDGRHPPVRRGFGRGRGSGLDCWTRFEAAFRGCS